MSRDRFKVTLVATVVVLVASGFWALTVVAGARQEAPVVLWRDHTTVSIVADSLRPIYSTSRFLGRVRLSPDAARILVLEAETATGRYGTAIVDTSSNVVARFDDESVLDADWCCGNMVVLHLGAFTSDGISSNGLVRWDYDRDSIERMELGSGVVTDFSWHEGEQRLFVKVYANGSGAQVVSYDPNTRMSSSTNLQGVHLSTDGEYVLDWDSEDPVPKLYARYGVEEISASLFDRAGVDHGLIEDWHPGTGHALIVRQLEGTRAQLSRPGERRDRLAETGEPRHVIIDAASGRSLREFAGRIWPRDRLAAGGAISVDRPDAVPTAVFATP